MVSPKRPDRYGHERNYEPEEAPTVNQVCTGWDEMLEGFRELGGTATNVCLKRGRFGRGLFPCDPTKRVYLHAPENLLFLRDDLYCENGALRVHSSSPVGSREKAWFEHYANTVAWAEGRKDVERFLESMTDLPEKLRNLLANRFGMRFCLEQPSPDAVLSRYLASRCINYDGKQIIMPIVELINHGPATKYEMHQGIAIKGLFPDEILVAYAQQDPLGIFQGWGFSTPQPVALSLPMTLTTRQGELVIGRQMRQGEAYTSPVLGEMRLPQVTADGRQTRLSYLTLGIEKSPRIPRGIFRRLFPSFEMAELHEAFEAIQHRNRMAFLGLIELLEDVHGPMVRPLREMARLQLQALSWSFGLRDL